MKISNVLATTLIVSLPFGAVADGLSNNTFTDPVVARPQYAMPQNTFTSQPYSAPNMNERSAARPAMVATDQFGNTYTTSNQPNMSGGAGGPLILARNGDLTYATLLYGFDSDDVRGLPIYAVIHDYLPNGTRGPLDGARISGQVQYSNEDASIVFNQAILPNGLEIPIQAVAVSDEDGRTGVAQNVNRHIVSRYGSLFLAGLIQGYGEVAQLQLQSRLDNGGGSTIIVGDGSNVTIQDREGPTDGEIIAGAIRPIGNNLSNAAAQNFNRPFTITAPSGMGLALVFLQTVVTQPSDVTGRAFNPRTGQVEAVRLTNDFGQQQGFQDQLGAAPFGQQQGFQGQQQQGFQSQQGGFAAGTPRSSIQDAVTATGQGQ